MRRASSNSSVRITPSRSPSSGPITFWPPSPARNRKISGVVKRAVRPERHQICVFIIGVRRDVKNAAKHVELLQCELNLAGIHLFWRQQRRRIGGMGRARDSEDRDHDGCSPTALSVAASDADRAMLWCVMCNGALSGERPIEAIVLVRDSPRYLLMSCFAWSDRSAPG